MLYRHKINKKAQAAEIKKARYNKYNILNEPILYSGKLDDLYGGITLPIPTSDDLYEDIVLHVVQWLKEYCVSAKMKGFIIGISGGVDSAVTSTLCAMTGLNVHCLEMSIHQKTSEVRLAMSHMEWLKNKSPQNVTSAAIDLTATFEMFRGFLSLKAAQNSLVMANTKSRLRMTTLYAEGQTRGLLVAGTGNKIEDFGVGFFTKYGDGGVDLSPIADLTKTQVYGLASYLGINQGIISAAPTDGLWDDGRTDESQLGATYVELEWAMQFSSRKDNIDSSELSSRQKEVLSIYEKQHALTLHKIQPIPICTLSKELSERLEKIHSNFSKSKCSV